MSKEAVFNKIVIYLLIDKLKSPFADPITVFMKFRGHMDPIIDPLKLVQKAAIVGAIAATQGVCTIS
jgi:hypothetical protein